MPVSATYQYDTREHFRDEQHKQQFQDLEVKREQIFNLLKQVNKPQFGETSASYQARIDDMLLDLAVIDRERADLYIADMLKWEAKRVQQQRLAEMDKKYVKKPDGRFATLDDGMTMIKKTRRAPMRYTSEQVHMMIMLRDKDYAYSEIAKAMRKEFGWTKQELPDAAVCTRIKQGPLKAKARRAVGDTDLHKVKEAAAKLVAAEDEDA